VVPIALKILIADDTPTNVKQVEAVVRKLGHIPLVATNGAQAVEIFRLESPDLVFMDIMMPEMDGITAVQKIREISTDKWTPIIFYSALDSLQDMVRGLESGGDDYVVKPATLPLLRAKITGYARLLGLQQENRLYTEELKNWRADAEEQERLGAHVMSRLTDAAGLRDSTIHHFNIPAETFSGDLLCAARGPGDVLNVMLADASGHGLSAALSAMPLTQAFYGMTAKGFPLSSIAEELNRKLKAILPADRFVAATLAAIDVRNQTVEVWNGGNPDALFLRPNGEIAMNWPARHPPLGVMPELIFSGMTETVVFHEPGDLIMTSDGLTEAETPAGEWLTLDGVVRLFMDSKKHESPFSAFQDGVTDFLQAPSGRDDISCMVVHVPIERRQQIRFAAPGVVKRSAVEDWRLDVSYSAQELRYIDMVPSILGFISQIKILKPHQGALFLVISELFNNALDHGLLGLDSKTKDFIGGVEIYLNQRTERLERLNDGRIDLSFQIHQNDDQAVLDISIQDSGPGFDYEEKANNANALQGGGQAHGRGIALVRNLCSEVVYSGVGNKVWVRYILGTLDALEDTLEADAQDEGNKPPTSVGGDLELF
jgi:CheY-like chemotaxis protein/anti-sigma regulatory factor (Ser/Thr protein kinase)